MPTARFVDANELVSETLRLLDLRESELRSTEGLDSHAEREKVRRGELRGMLWLGPKDDAVALVTWQEVGRALRKAEVYLEASLRRPETLRALVGQLLHPPVAPWVIVRVPGWPSPSASLSTVLEPYGFRHLQRFDMNFPPDRPLPDPSGSPALRPLTSDDAGPLSDLLAVAYSDFALDPTYFSPGVPLEEDARTAVRTILQSELGSWWASASMAVQFGNKIVAATLVVDHHGPLIAEVAVHPDHRRRGYARAAIRGSLSALRREGASTPRLVVTAVNHRARALYESLGFVYVPLPEDNTWFNLRAAGRPDLADVLPSEIPDAP